VQLGLSISFLCDRLSTEIPKSQPGFINFTTVTEFLPGMKKALANVRQTKQNWEEHIETE
jgi:hypothetical protein